MRPNGLLDHKKRFGRFNIEMVFINNNYCQLTLKLKSGGIRNIILPPCSTQSSNIHSNVTKKPELYDKPFSSYRAPNNKILLHSTSSRRVCASINFPKTIIYMPYVNVYRFHKQSVDENAEMIQCAHIYGSTQKSDTGEPTVIM